MKVGSKEVQAWVDKIKEKGFRKFQLKELPDELKDKTMLLRAKKLDLIYRIGKDNKCVTTWEINDNNGKNNEKIKTSRYDRYDVKSN